MAFALDHSTDLALLPDQFTLAQLLVRIRAKQSESARKLVEELSEAYPRGQRAVMLRLFRGTGEFSWQDFVKALDERGCERPSLGDTLRFGLHPKKILGARIIFMHEPLLLTTSTGRSGHQSKGRPSHMPRERSKLVVLEYAPHMGSLQLQTADVRQKFAGNVFFAARVTKKT